jgi:hypothetical protein
MNTITSSGLQATSKTEFRIILRVVTLSAVLLLLLASGSYAQKQQKEPAENAPRPMDALGMTYEALHPHLGPCKGDCRQQEREAKLGHRATFELPPYAYTVEGGKVIRVVITAESFDGFIAEGKEKWGPPSSLVYQALANPDGTESHYGEALWNLPGGVRVDARQSPVPGKILGVAKLNLGGSPVDVTEREPTTVGAIVTITNLLDQPKEKPKPRPLL